MANRYYTSFSLGLGEVILQGPEARHLATVMRARPGDAVCLFNGDGAEYSATVIAIAKRDVTLRVDLIARPQRELAFQLEIAAAVPKGDREEFLIEKLTELGVSRFVPLITERSVVVPKVERLRRTVIEASKQCGRNVLMEVSNLQTFNEYLRASANLVHRWLAHPRIEAGDGNYSTEHRPPQGNLGDLKPGTRSIAIGPEGGLTDAEVAEAVGAGWRLVNLGRRILRIETAAVGLAAYCSFNANNA